jgi:DNA-directed RNA polymerase III subunit RPC3
MANTFGGFVHTSPLSSLPHDPPLTLASNCVRDFFGPIVQTVFDALVKGGGSMTLAALTLSVRHECKRDWNEERERLVVRGKYKLQRAKGPSSAGYVVEASSIRGAVLVLLQHDILSIERKGEFYVYKADVHKARLITRYPRIVEYVKKVMDETAAAIIETLLLEGKLETVDVILENSQQSLGSTQIRPLHSATDRGRNISPTCRRKFCHPSTAT